MNTSFDDSSICQANIFTQDQVDYRLMVNLPVSLFGMITNLLNVIVFTQSEMRTSLVNHFLLAISISDLLLLICNFFFLIFPVLSWMSKSFILNDTYPVVLRFCYPLARIAQTCGVYLTLFVSVHRFLGVCYPFRAKRWITATPVAYAICGAVLFSVLINVTTWIELCVVPCYSKQFNRTTRQIQMTAISQEYMYGLVVRVIAYTTFMFVVPFVTLIIVNVRIMMALHDSSRLRQRNSQRQGAIPKNELSNDNSTPMLTTFRMLHSAKYSELFSTILKLNDLNILRRPNIVKATNSVRERSVTIMLLVIVAIFLGCNGEEVFNIENIFIK
ncbi:hypothetical protein AB6A40_001055 [Gnathostoma spinigerum]|uniref:G-protein coupled receptors family 1 profile domain-containing protein n=1 Tax=Gnathostoma spinigerum TaxID=75299 RepID=A0ABD6E4K4_9BILA